MYKLSCIETFPKDFEKFIYHSWYVYQWISWRNVKNDSNEDVAVSDCNEEEEDDSDINNWKKDVNTMNNDSKEEKKVIFIARKKMTTKKISLKQTV